MKVKNWLESAQNRLSLANIDTARLDCLVLLADLLGKDKSWILANPEFKLNKNEVGLLDKQITRRINHEPLSYIRGKSEFYGREFLVSRHTLEPRPETETMIDMLIKLRSTKVVDIGTGSGCIAITAKLEIPGTEVLATDVSSSCIETAKQNAKRLKADIEILKSDLLTSVKDTWVSGSAICCNLPYVPDSFKINKAATHEPKLAIFGGADGLDCYRNLFAQLSKSKAKPEFLLTESLPPQHPKLVNIAKSNDYELVDTNDFIQLFKPS